MGWNRKTILSFFAAMMMISTAVLLFEPSSAEEPAEEAIEEISGIEEITPPSRITYNGDTYTVGSDPGDDSATIQGAVDLCSDGDIVQVSPGDYEEEVLVESEIWIKGEDGATLLPLAVPVNGYGFELDASNVTITGFNMSKFDVAVYSNSYGHNISDNEFHMNDRDVYIYIKLIDYNKDIRSEGFVFDDNIVSRSNSPNSVEIFAEIDYDEATATSTDFGDTFMRNNIMSSTSSSGNLFELSIYVYEKMGGTLNMGDVFITGNTLRGGGTGIDIYGDFARLEDVDIDMGDMIIRNNVIRNINYYGIYVDYYDFTYLYGNTNVQMGDLVVMKNDVRSTSIGSGGIHISDFTYWEYFYNNSYLITGNATITENTIETGKAGSGIYFYYSYLAYDFYDDSRAITQNLYITDNVILDAGTGISLDVEDAYDMYDRSHSELGDIIVTGNEVSCNGDALYLYTDNLGSYMYDNSTFIMGDIIVRENDLHGSIASSSQSGIEIYYEYLGYYMYNDSSAMIGTLLITDNNISGSYGLYWDYFEYIAYEMDHNSVFKMGDLNISGNRVRSDQYGLYINYFFEVGYDLYGDANAVIGDMLFNDNLFWSDNYGIYWDYFEYLGYGIYDSSYFEMGDISVSGNEIICDGEAIYIYYFEYFGYYLYDSSAVVLGSFLFNENYIRTNDTGIYIYEIYELGTYLYDNSSFSMENIEVCRNDIVSFDEGIYVDYFDYFGYYMYNWSSFEMGSILLNNNTVFSENNYGFYIAYIHFFGSEMEERSSFKMENIEICGNDIVSNYSSIYVFYIEGFGYYMYGASYFEMNDILINDNTLRSTDGEGLYVSQFNSFGYEPIGQSTFVMNNIEICRNDINSDSDGIYVEYFEYFGVYGTGTSSFTMEDILVCNNTIVSNSTGLYLKNIYDFGYDMGDNATAFFGDLHIDGNDITAGEKGIYLSNIEYLGESNEQDSIFEYGDITMNDNIVNAGTDGILLGAYYYILCYFKDNAVGNVGWLKINNNQIESEGYGIRIEDFDKFGYWADNNVRLSADGFQIIGNHITSTSSAIGIINSEDFALKMEGDASVTMGPWIIRDNTASSASFAVEIQLDEMGREVYSGNAVMEGLWITDNVFDTANGIDVRFNSADMMDHANITIGKIIIENNQFLRVTDLESVYIGIFTNVTDNSSFEVGKAQISYNEMKGSNGSLIHINHGRMESGNANSVLADVTIMGNNITGSSVGLELEGVQRASVYVNNFIANVDDLSVGGTILSLISPDPMWYRWGMRNYSSRLGNYWDSYTEPDADDDGIGDNPYNTGYGTDSKPLITGIWDLLPPWNDVTPPDVVITYPADGAHISVEDIVMTWTVTDDLLGVHNQWVKLDDDAWVEVGLDTEYTFPSISEGSHILYVRAVDVAGNEDTVSSFIIVDRTAPDAFIVSPDNLTAYNVLSVDVEWNATDAFSDMITFYLRLDLEDAMDMGNALSYTFMNLSEGMHKITVTAEDEAGNTDEAHIWVVIDLTDPTVDILHPLDGMIVTEELINATWIGDGGPSGIGSYHYSLDGANLTDAGMLTYNVFTSLSAGNHTLEVVCYDGAGNMGSEIVEFIIDTTAEAVHITYPLDGSFINRTSFDARWIVNGLTGALVSTHYRINSGDWMEISGTSAFISNLTEGVYTLEVRLTAENGEDAFAESQFTIDLTSPEIDNVTHEGTNAIAKGPVQIIFSEPISYFEATVNGNAAVGEIDGNALILEMNDIEPGTEYTIVFTVKDLAGNQMESSISFTTATIGTVTGRIVDEDGKPVSGAKVVFDTGEEVITNDNGEFTAQVPSGSRTAKIYDSDGNEIGELDMEVTAGGTNDSGETVVEPKEDDGGFPVWIILIILLLILIIAGIVFFMFNKKAGDEEEEDMWGDDEEEEEDEEEDEEDEDEDYFDEEDDEM